jgi:hypothetical protein
MKLLEKITIEWNDESMRRLNIQPVVTDLLDIDAAVQAFIDGRWIDYTELLH